MIFRGARLAFGRVATEKYLREAYCRATFSLRHCCRRQLREARGAESHNDFIHKLGVAWKEMREAWYWIRLVFHVSILKPAIVGDILHEADELSRILVRS